MKIRCPTVVVVIVVSGARLRVFVWLVPKGFGLSRRGPDDVAVRARRAMQKLALFVTAWVAAFVFLPAGWVALALLAWAALVLPGIVEMHRAFQSVDP
jgi:hypothetical protein